MLIIDDARNSKASWLLDIALLYYYTNEIDNDDTLAETSMSNTYNYLCSRLPAIHLTRESRGDQNRINVKPYFIKIKTFTMSVGVPTWQTDIEHT